MDASAAGENSEEEMSGRFKQDPPSSASSDRSVISERQEHALEHLLREIDHQFRPSYR